MYSSSYLFCTQPYFPSLPLILGYVQKFRVRIPRNLRSYLMGMRILCLLSTSEILNLISTLACKHQR
jgi:hypothetical protein